MEALVVGVGGGECILAAAIQLKGFVVVLINHCTALGMCTDDDDDDDIDDDKGFVVGLINHCIALHWGCALMTMMMTRALGLC